MPEPREDDLFKESTMTFGEHLEELRTCLFKSAAGLAVGFILGLCIGKYIADFIQQPLRKALDKFYQNESLERSDAELARLKESGQPLPWTQDEAEKRVRKEHLLMDEYFVDSRELLLKLKNAYPNQFNDAPLPQDTKQSDDHSEKLVPLFLWHPSKDDARLQSKSLGTVEPFTVWVKVSLLMGVLLASPWIFYQIWHFVAAGLYPNERYYVHIYGPASLGLFLLGASLAFFVVFEPVLNFLLSFNRNLGIAPELRITEWLNFVLILPVGFGLGFQLPLVMLFMERIGLFTVKSYLAQWRLAVLAIFVVAAVFAPPDPYSMLLLAFPLTILYFGGILLCKLLPRKTNPFGEIAVR